MNLENLNHIFAVISIFGFLYGRRVFLKDLKEAHILDESAEINQIIEDLHTGINAKIKSALGAPTKILKGIEPIASLNIDSGQVGNAYIKINIIVKNIKKEYEVKKNKYIHDRDAECDNISTRFKNISFLIALLSFTYLILAAFYPHNTSKELGNFIIFGNSSILISMLVLIRREKVTQNIYVILFFIGSIIIAGIAAIISHYFCIIPVFFFSGVMIYVAILLIIPWLICYFFHSSKYKTCKERIATELDSKTIRDLQSYEIVLKGLGTEAKKA